MPAILLLTRALLTFRYTQIMSFGGGFATVYTLQVIVILTHSTAVRSFALSAYLA